MMASDNYYAHGTESNGALPGLIRWTPLVTVTKIDFPRIVLAPPRYSTCLVTCLVPPDSKFEFCLR